jgi:hypothetical protein
MSYPLLQQPLHALVRPLALLACTAAATAAIASPAAPARRVATPNLPLTFERNTGHWPKEVQFVARSGGGTLFLTRREAVLALRKGDKATTLRLMLQGSNAKAVASGLEKQPGIVNYFLGKDPAKWRTNVPTYSRVKLAGVYPGVDLVTYGAGRSRTLEYDFVVRPGADPKQIRMAVSGAKSLRTVGGKLIASTACGDVALNRPYAYQTIGGVRKHVACAFTLEHNTVAFQVARYDAGRPLVVDPTLEYSTYLGDADQDYGAAVAIDGAGAAYVTGRTLSTAFPTTAGAFNRTRTGNYDAFVTKMAADGKSLAYSTYIGGSARERAYAIAVDAAGSAFITGDTYSTAFPTTAGAYSTTLADWRDAFITKLSPSGSSLVYSTYLGGADDETAYGIAIDGAGAAYVTGSTLSVDFPTTAGAFWTEHNGDEEAFVSKLSADGGSLPYSTFLGGASAGVGSAIAVDGTGAACVAGQTGSSDFPTTVDAYDRSLDGPSDAFITKLNADGSALVFSTLLGGSDDDYASGVALDSGGAAVVVGSTYSVDLPVGGYDTSLGGLGDGFVAKLAVGGSSLVFATYLGGADYDDICAVAVDGAGAIYVAGYTSSTDYPTTADAYATKKLDYEDAFVSKLGAEGTALTYSTYLGGSGTDRGYGIAVNVPGTATVVTGYTTDTGYPTTSGAFGTTFSGRSDAFVTKITAATVQPTTLTVDTASGAPGASVSLTAKLAGGGGAGVSGKSVTFTIDGTGIGSATTAATGIATLAYAATDALSAGAHTLGGAFAGDATYEPSSGSNTLTVTQATTGLSTVDRTGLVTTTVALKAYLKRTTDNAWLSGRAVAFTVAGTGVGSANTDASGQALLNYTVATAAGAHAIGVSFAADTLYKASSATATLTATTTNTKVYVVDRTAKVKTYTVLKSYLYTPTNVIIPGKPMVIKLDGTGLASGNTNSSGYLQVGYTVTEGAGAGIRTIRGEFAGDGGYMASANTGKLTVTAGDLYIWPYVRSGKKGTNHVLKAYVRSLPDYAIQPGKSITFKVNGSEVGTSSVAADGWASATWAIPAGEATGAHTAAAGFAGDAWYKALTATTGFNVVP